MNEAAPSFYSFSHQTTTVAMERHDLHCHAFYEVYYFVRGDVDYMVEGAHLNIQPDTMLLLAPGAFHGYRTLSARPYERFALHFMPDIVPEVLRDEVLHPFAANRTCLMAGEMRTEFDALERCRALNLATGDAAQWTRTVALLLALLSYLRGSNGPKSYEPSLVELVTAYIGAHLSEPMSVESLARRFYVSRSQLDTAFSQEAGTAVAAYVRRKRVAYAQQLILQGTKRTLAAQMAGFSDYSVFYRALRRMQEQSEIG